MILFSSKKSQFMVFSGFFLIALLYFIYSIETQNTYIIKNGDFILLENYNQEICGVLKSNVGITLNSSINSLELDFSNYCTYAQFDCIFDIYNITQAPPNGNWSLLNESQFRILMNINSTEFNYYEDFNCSS